MPMSSEPTAPDPIDPQASHPEPINPYAAPLSSSAYLDPNQVFANGPVLATLGDRLAGAIIDSLILLPILMAAGFGLGMLLINGNVPNFGTPIDSFLFEFLTDALFMFIFAIGFVAINGYLLKNRGQTIGKVVMKTRIVSESDSQLVPLGSLIMKRYATIWGLSLLPVVGSFISLINALLIFRQNRKCMHDDIAKTIVIKIPNRWHDSL
ncbi:MAG: RDD family protein [Planctomycetota bacterium]